MPISMKAKRRNSSIILAIFGASFLLPGLGLLLFKAIPELLTVFSGVRLSTNDSESLLAVVMVGIVFSLVGGGLVYWGLKAPTDDPALLDSDTPWLGRKNWASPEIKDNFALTGGLLWGFALIWNLLSTPAMLAIPDELNKGNQAIWFAVLFPIAGLAIIALAIRKTLEWRRFGQIKVTLDPYPGAIGGNVAGNIHLATPLPPGTDLQISLDCVRHYRQGKSSNQSVVWQYSRTVQPIRSSRSTSAQFLFEVPEDLPPSSIPDSSYHSWTLHINAELAGVDLSRQVEIPVFATGAKASESLRRHARASTSANVSTSGIDKTTGTSLLLNASNESVEIIGEHGRKGFSAGLLVGLVFMLMGGGMGYFIGSLKAELGFLGFGLLFGGIDLLVLIFTITGRFKRYHLRLAKPLVELNRQSLFGTSSTSTHYDDIASVTTKPRGSMQTGGKHYEFFNLVLELKNGELVRIGEKLSRQQAEGLADGLLKHFGLTPEPLS
ncbi:MAG: hypothetical protein KUG71_06065 [Porticoccaceae bacterium]|nr:hypothetical protein [Porticoccaceae bacterium]